MCYPDALHVMSEWLGVAWIEVVNDGDPDSLYTDDYQFPRRWYVARVWRIILLFRTTSGHGLNQGWKKNDNSYDFSETHGGELLAWVPDEEWQSIRRLLLLLLVFNWLKFPPTSVYECCSQHFSAGREIHTCYLQQIVNRTGHTGGQYSHRLECIFCKYSTGSKIAHCIYK